MGENSAVTQTVVRMLGRTDYVPTWRAMQAFTALRGPDTPDEIWITEHFPVYTLGLNKRGVNPPLRNDIPLVETDRGGKITYHGPGQVVIYLLLDLKRRKLSVRQLVSRMEGAVITMLEEYGIAAHARSDAPGVYVQDKKIAALGLRLKNGCCYHGLSLNVDMDLTPFDTIDPCGYQGLEITQTRNLGIEATAESLAGKLQNLIVKNLNQDVLH
jgi:lipoyl(octanoyl) transferase